MGIVGGRHDLHTRRPSDLGARAGDGRAAETRHAAAAATDCGDAPVPDDIRYGLGIFDARGWIGHNGSIPGYQTLAIYSPAEQTTVVALLNTDVAKQPAQPSTLFGTAITKVISPDHVFLLENAIPQPR